MSAISPPTKWKDTKYGNAMKRTYSDSDKATYLAALDANGGNISLTAKQTGVPRNTLSDWAKGRNLNAEVTDLRHLKKGELADRIGEVAHALLESIYTRATGDFSPLVPLRDYATSFGIIVDKMQLLKGEPTAINKMVTLTPEQQQRINKIMAKRRDAELQAEEVEGNH